MIEEPSTQESGVKALELESPIEMPAKAPGYAEYDGSAEVAAKGIGLTRRPFFVWLGKGRNHNDPLPCRVPASVPEWYERMRARGEFKHRCPDSVLAACRSVPSSTPPSSESQASASSGPSSFQQDSMVRRELMFQLEDLESHLERLRLATETARQKNNADGDDEVRRHIKDRTDLLDKASLIRKRLVEQDEAEGRLIDPGHVSDDIKSIVPPLIDRWQNEGSRAFREFNSSLPRHEFLRLWRTYVVDVCRGLAKSKFAKFEPPLQLEAS